MNVTLGIKPTIITWLAKEPAGTTAAEACSRYVGVYKKQHVHNSLSVLRDCGDLVAVDEPFGKSTRRRYFHPEHAPSAKLRPLGGNPIVRAGRPDDEKKRRTLDQKAQVAGDLPEPIQGPNYEDRRFKADPDFAPRHFRDLRPGQYDRDSAGRWAEAITERL